MFCSFMAESYVWSSVTLTASIILGVIALLSEEYRSYAIIIGVAFIFVTIIFSNYFEIAKLKRSNREVVNNLDIHKDLIDIKADINSLKRRK